jgi:predicted pyridoxine 5'-phosphate oxidase superfamily flavin-nucleotide-binding protein
MELQRPGSAGEHALQERYDTFKRAAAFYDKQMLDHLNPLMREYIARQEMAFIATADGAGECDASFRAGPPGFVRVIDERTVMYPEYRGNGVLASLGNITENAHVGILFVDFFHSGVGLHVNGRARVLESDVVEAFTPMLTRMAGVERLWDPVDDKKKTPERWVMVEVVEAYIHCSKHIPLLRHDLDSQNRQSGDFFRAKHDPRPWIEQREAQQAVPQQAEPEPVFEGESCSLVVEEPAVAQVSDEPRHNLVAGPEIFLDEDDDRAGAAEPQPAAAEPAAPRADDELDFLLPPAWGALRR